MKTFIFLVLSTFIILGCKQPPPPNPCPYEPLAYNIVSTTTENTESSKISSDITGKLDGYLKKIGHGGISVEVKPEFDNVTKKLTQANIKYDSMYVQRYNAMVTDICGKIKLLDNENFSKDEKTKIVKQILQRTETFYEQVIENPAKKDTSTLITEEHDSTNSPRSPKNDNSENNKEHKTSEVLQESEYKILTPEEFGEQHILHVHKNGQEIDVNGRGSSVPLSVRKGDKIKVEFTNGNIKTIIYNGKNL